MQTMVRAVIQSRWRSEWLVKFVKWKCDVGLLCVHIQYLHKSSWGWTHEGPKYVELQPKWSIKTYSVKSYCVSRWTIYVYISKMTHGSYSVTTNNLFWSSVWQKNSLSIQWHGQDSKGEPKLPNRSHKGCYFICVFTEILRGDQKPATTFCSISFAVRHSEWGSHF